MRFFVYVGVGVFALTALFFGLHFHMRASGPPPIQLFSDDTTVRLCALATLQTRGEETYKRVLVMAFEDGEEIVRAEAAERLGYLWGDMAKAALVRLLREGGHLVRAGVVEGLRSRGGPPPLWLKRVLKDEKEPLVRALLSDWERKCVAP